MVVTGSFEGTVDLGTGPLVSAGSRDGFLARYGPDGTPLWTMRFGTAAFEEPVGIAIDGAGNLLITGSFDGPTDLGTGPLAVAGLTDAFVASFDANGTARWARSFGGGGWEFARGIAVDGSGDAVITGSFEGTVDTALGTLTSAGGTDAFLARYGADGTFRGARGFGGANSDQGWRVATDSNGNATLVGTFRETVDFGTGPLTSAGGTDVFVASYDAAGNARWAKRVGAAQGDIGHDVATDANGNVFGRGGPWSAPAASMEADAFEGDDFVTSHSVAHFEGVAPGSHVVRVRLVNSRQETVVARTVILSVQGSTAVTVVITRDSLEWSAPLRTATPP